MSDPLNLDFKIGIWLVIISNLIGWPSYSQ